jgi:DNA gyrase/topoisomerase IV subunit A
MRHLLEYKAERKELDQKIRINEPYVMDDGTLIKKEIYNELSELANKYGDKRNCIVKSIDEENQIPKGIFKIVITDKNYIRKITDTDRVNIVRKDNPKFILRVDNTDNILIFDNKGKVFNFPVHRIPITDKTSPGTDVRILIRNLTSNIISVFPESIFKTISEHGKKHYLVVATKSNTIKKLQIEDFLNVGPSGLIYSKVKDEDEVAGLALAPHDLDVVINSNHKALRCKLKDISLLKRNAYGPKAMNTDEPINGLSIIYPDTPSIIVLTKNGKVNKFDAQLMSSHSRGSKGSSCIKLDSNDEIFGIYSASESDVLRVVTSESIEEIPINTIKSKSSIAAGQKIISSKGIILKVDIIKTM